MFKKVDLLGAFGAAMMVAGLVCFLISKSEPAWAAYLGGRPVARLLDVDPCYALVTAAAHREHD